MKKALIIIFLALSCGIASAKNVPGNTFTFADNDTISLQLSSLNLNRLVVRDDKITNITCPNGFCTSFASKTDLSGSINLRINVALPFNAHILTKNGRAFSLFINPVARPSVVTEFVGMQNAQKQKSVFERKFDYPIAVAELTRSMLNWTRNKTPVAGFSVHQVDPKTLPKVKDELAVIPQTVFVGKDYSGIIYVVQNRGTKTIAMTNAQFYSYAARSASLDKFTLVPGEKTKLYVVTGGGVDHVSNK